MNNKPIIRHVVFTRKTKHVVSPLFRTMEQAISCQGQLNSFSGRCQYFAGMVYYAEDPADRSRYIVVRTHPEGLTLPMTPPPAAGPAQSERRTR